MVWSCRFDRARRSSARQRYKMPVSVVGSQHQCDVLPVSRWLDPAFCVARVQVRGENLMTVATGAQRGSRPYRVVQWATGNIGMRSLRAVLEHPNLSLVGLYVHSEAKAGRDAGELCGLRAAGVRATRSIDEILALEADCVLYMSQGCNFDELCRLLASGANVITTRTELNNPACLDSATRARIEEACRRGHSSVHATGSSPGFITEAIPLLLTSIQRRLECLRIHEYADVSSRASPQLLFQIMGFGQVASPAAVEGRAQYLAHS
ncbi:MAG TPA: hypothetical protein VFZ61_26420, partial [Polyangiales bacterium]